MLSVVLPVGGLPENPHVDQDVFMWGGELPLSFWGSGIIGGPGGLGEEGGGGQSPFTLVSTPLNTSSQYKVDKGVRDGVTSPLAALQERPA